MSNNKTHDEILAYITEHGETGVNDLAKVLNLPVANVQRYLTRQTYFRKTSNRKWDLPSNVDADIKSNTMSLMVDSVENALMLLNAQLTEIQSSVQNALMPVSTLKRAVLATNITVAGKTPKIDKRLTKIDEYTKKINEVFEKQKAKIPEEYTEFIFGFDYVGMVLAMGQEYTDDFISGDIFKLVSGSEDKLDDDVLDLLKEYQRGKDDDKS